MSSEEKEWEEEEDENEKKKCREKEGVTVKRYPAGMCRRKASYQ